MKSRRVTQHDIAAKAKVSRATVSLALRQHPSIPENTRTRVMKVAKSLGYTPDPMLSALAAYRNEQRASTFHGTLAWIVRSDASFDWKQLPHYRDYHAGAQLQAETRGYKLEVFDLNAPGVDHDRTAGILKARNIPGALLCPQPFPNAIIDFAWENLSAVTFGYTLASPRLHTVTTTHYRNTQQTMRELRSRGYQRIGLAFGREHDERIDHNTLAGYLVEEYLVTEQWQIPPLFESCWHRPDLLAAWLKKHQPDAIVTGEHRILEILSKLKIDTPVDLGVACTTLPRPDRQLAGTYEDSRHIGAVAVDTLVALIQRGERGVPVQPQRIHVEGQWVEGKSLRPKIDPTR